MKRRKATICCYYFIQIIGLTFVLLGILFLLEFEFIYNFILKTALTVQPGTRAYNGWVKTDPPLTMDVYFFNWTNPEDLYNASVKPSFEEVGPYRFWEVHEKYDVTLEGDTILYSPLRRYYFAGKDSPRQLDDVINTINSLAVIGAHKARYYGSFKKFMFALSLSATSKLRLQQTVDELLFTGYEDKLLNMVRPLAPFLSIDIGDRYGYFYGRNGTKGLHGNYTVHIKNDENFGNILAYNGRNRTEFFEDRCGEVRGSIGDFYPLDQKRTVLNMFVADACSNFELDYEKDVVFKGINAYKFVVSSMFENGQRKSENRCFCKDGCMPSGVFNLSECRMGAPMFLSQPHFYNADPYYGSLIEGMRPDQSKHEFYTTMEPKTAITIDVAARMQLNILLHPISGISMFQNVPEVYFPIFYVDETINLSDEVIIGVKLLQTLPRYNTVFSSGLIVLGLIILTITFLWWLHSLRRKSEFQRCPTNEFPLKDS